MGYVLTKSRTSSGRDKNTTDTLARTCSGPVESEALRVWAEDFFYQEQMKHIPRKFKFLSSSIGWRLLDFVSLQELLGGLQDAIAGHRWLCGQGILHRNINFDSILLTGRPAPNRAILIDLDGRVAHDDEGSTASRIVGQGTLAFMSYKVISGLPYSFVKPGSPELTGVLSDNADIEPQFTDSRRQHQSFFWVLVWLSMSREGPGSRRISWPNDWKVRDSVQMRLSQAFGADVSPLALADWKHTVFHYRPSAFYEVIVPLFAPYFDRSIVGAVAIYLYAVLLRAYIPHDFNSVELYEEFDNALAKAERHVKTKTWEDTKAAYKKMAEDATRKREKTCPSGSHRSTSPQYIHSHE
ncbi:hypothetical protein BV25DRAFT_1842420 [Artomyces pyxidatus]|uniref:Uncharacterized protein n=1 Tax=Artomyces pyxidatus TaxID=48021 RepID=A0ACB8SI51_9AGAM|nr:hypothetical protein BV25DRAFT_1842420 [Artomyces pyxidatus]